MNDELEINQLKYIEVKNQGYNGIHAARQEYICAKCNTPIAKGEQKHTTTLRIIWEAVIPADNPTGYVHLIPQPIDWCKPPSKHITNHFHLSCYQPPETARQRMYVSRETHRSTLEYLALIKTGINPDAAFEQVRQQYAF